MKRINKYIQFEVETRMGLLFLSEGTTISASQIPLRNAAPDYQEMSEEDVAMLGRLLGGL
ncbi:hypothetical protein BRE01_17830 [Brevibacillus reuszeri]|nr:hypothetical protein [Brevibacillus reuszeri]MED1856230.1 hypothetical protein [Brevibacillus reuszeri]GED68081.1 hypothetical protein BRE01_17830 [Brevibacillus reuszeri]